jgi:hypothetical protein
VTAHHSAAASSTPPSVSMITGIAVIGVASGVGPGPVA